MGLHFNSIDIYGDDACKALRKCIARTNRQAAVERTVAFCTVWVLWQIIKAQNEKIKELEGKVKKGA